MATEYSLPPPPLALDPTDLLDALSTGIIMLDAQLCAIYANVAAQDLLAFSLNKARGRHLAIFCRTRTDSSVCCAVPSTAARASRIVS